MSLVTVANLKYTIGTRVLLDGASLSIAPGERIGLVGRNGAGKTTLIKILAGKLQPDSGVVSIAKGARVGYLSQDPDLDPTQTLRHEAASGFVELTRLHDELDEVFRLMGLPENAAPDRMERLLKRQADLQHKIEAVGGYAVDHKIDQILHGLGFTDAQFAIPVSGLSGGQKGRLALAKLLLEAPDILLLDEPTNHLDIAGCEWLEAFLVSEFTGAVLMISHDRYVLDNVVTRIEEVENGRLIDYPGNYSDFCEIRAQRLLTQNRAYENQQTKFKQEEAYIRKYKAGQRARQAQGRLSKLERQKQLFSLERPAELAAMRMALPEAPRSGDQVVMVRGAAKAYANPHAKDASAEDATRVLFRDFSVTISRGERWAIIGPNGAGKTTMVRAMLGELPLDSGSARLGANVVIGYYQQMPPEVDGDTPVYQYLQNVIRREIPGVQMSEQAARDLAGVFLFSGDDQNKLLGVMSGGERSRARLAGLLASAKNLIVLDEPTNHLDIPSCERLEAALAPGEDGAKGGYDGTLILISHDRALIDATCDHLIVLDGRGGATVFHGSYSEWHEKQKVLDAERAKAKAEADYKAEQKAKISKTPSAASGSKWTATPDKPERPGKKTGLSWMPMERLEAEIEKLGKALKAADAELSTEAVYRDPKKCQEVMGERDELAAELERHEEEWLRRAEDAS